MKKYQFFLFLAVILLAACGSPKKNAKTELITKGLFNIAELGFDEIISLHGEFAFAPGKFVSPMEPIEVYERFENPAISWSKYSPAESLYGYGTYAIKISGFSDSAVYALKIPACSSAIKIFANGNEIFNSGTPAVCYADEILQWKPGLAVIPTNEKEDITFVFHISNFHDQKAGFFKPLSIGFYSSMISKNNIDFFKQSAEFSVLLVMGGFFISLFMFYPKEKTFMYFGILAWNFALRILCYEDFLITFIFPNISGVLLDKLGYLTFALAPIFFGLFIEGLFGPVRKRFLYPALIPPIIYGAAVIFTYTYIFSALLLYIQVYTLLMGLFFTGIVVRALIKKKKAAIFFLIGCFILLVLVVRDTLISNGVITGSFSAQFGIFALLLPMAFIVLRQFAFIFTHAAKISGEITEINEALAKFVPNEFMTFLNKKHTEVKLGDNILKNMFIVFVHLGVNANLEKKSSRKEMLTVYNSVLAHINPLIEQYNGFIDKYLPQGIMILFHGSAYEVMQCMMEIYSHISILNIERDLEAKPSVHFSAGVHYGQLMLGTIGEAARMDSTVISDTVNVAARLHAYAVKMDGHVFMSSTVKELIEDEFWEAYSCRHHGQITFKGKEKSVDVYEVVTV